MTVAAVGGGNHLQLASGLRIAEPLDRLGRFCREEYAYYDAVAQEDPDKVTPLDVIVTTAVNAFSTASARKIRDIHRGLLKVQPLLAEVPREVSLQDASALDLDAVRRLLKAAVAVPGVLVAVATKVLHRKRPALIPILDSVIIGYYRQSSGERWLSAAWEDERRAAEAAVRVMQLFREDLLGVRDQLEQLTRQLSSEGFRLTPVRALELLIWTEAERQGYYRQTSAVPPAAAATTPRATAGTPDAPASPVEAQLHAWAREFARQHDLPSGDLRISPPLREDESDGLTLALANGLVVVDRGGQFRLVGAAASKGPYHLFSRGDRPSLNREYLIQVVAFAELVLDHGWVAKDVAFEHDALVSCRSSPLGIRTARMGHAESGAHADGF